MKKIEVVIHLSNKAVKFLVTANTEFDAKQLVKTKLINSLTDARTEIKGLA
jgi:hypothetical protein